MLKTLAVASLAVMATSAVSIDPAAAKIRCKGSYQVIPGVGPHSSPYCEIKNLARVARGSYGISTSFAKLRTSDSEREQVCQAIGHDNRVYSTCLEYRNDSDARRIR